MRWEEAKIVELLLSQNYVTEEDVTRAKRAAATGRGTTLDFLFAEGLVTKDLVGQAIAESLKLPYADLNSHPPSVENVLKIPASVGMKRRVVLYNEQPKRVVVATDAPSKDLKAALKSVFKSKTVTVAFALTEDVDDALLHYRPPIEQRLKTLIGQGGRVAPELVDTIIGDAVARRASDIHLEPRDGYVELRFRIDGVLQHIARLEPEVYERVLNRIKVLARLRTDEHYAPQDGSIHLNELGGGTDIRVSVVPIFDGEKIVMRLLSKYTRGLALSSLGMLTEDQQLISSSAKKPFGMILVTGPTGSGKSTSLYALMKRLNQPEVNIATVEDPVEYRLPGVNHIQVDPDRELTFARGLRSIVRQDPDVIMVGEIRDEETAEIAVNAALTGHMLLSTFHANDASTSIPRLLDMGIEPFLLSSTLELVIAQRLVRRLCDNCRVSKTVTTASVKKQHPEAAAYLSGKQVTLYGAKGCNVCAHTGFDGRTGVFEMIRVTPAMRELIQKAPNAAMIWELAKREGARSMFEDGMIKVRSGETTIAELRRVVAPPEFYGQETHTAKAKKARGTKA